MDARKLTLPIAVVVAILAGTLGLGWKLSNAVTTSENNVRADQTKIQIDQAKMQSDVRDILTRMQNAAELDRLQKEMQEARMAEIKSSVDDLKRQSQLLQLQYAELSKLIPSRR